MSIALCIQVACRALTVNRARSALTMLGVIIGVCTVIVVVSIGEGATQRVTEAVNSLGTNLLTVRTGAERIRLNAAGRSATNPASSTSTTITLGPSSHLTMADATLIAGRFTKTVEAVAPQLRGDDLPIRYQAVDSKSDVFGVTLDYPLVNNANIKHG